MGWHWEAWRCTWDQRRRLVPCSLDQPQCCLQDTSTLTLPALAAPPLRATLPPQCNESWMQGFCQFSCKRCPLVAPAPPAPPPTPPAPASPPPASAAPADAAAQSLSDASVLAAPLLAAAVSQPAAPSPAAAAPAAPAPIGLASASQACSTDVQGFLASSPDLSLFASLLSLSGHNVTAAAANLSSADGGNASGGASTASGGGAAAPPAFSVFVPTNDAMRAWLASEGLGQAQLLGSRERLRSVAAYHATLQPLAYADLGACELGRAC